MTTWWPIIGETSLVTGSVVGLLWAIYSTSRRRRKFLRASLPPKGQRRWFVLSLVSMSSYVTLVAALGLASVHGLVPPAMFWFLLVLSSGAYMSALLFPGIESGRRDTESLRSAGPPASPPLMPLKRSA